MLSMHPSARIVVMSMLDKAKEFAGRIADINQRVQTGNVNISHLLAGWLQ